MTYRSATIIWICLFAGFVVSTLIGCSDPTDTACGRLDHLLDDHGDITSPEEALDLADELWDIGRDDSDISDELKTLSLAITADHFDDTYLEASSAIDERCGR